MLWVVVQIGGSCTKLYMPIVRHILRNLGCNLVQIDFRSCAGRPSHWRLIDRTKLGLCVVRILLRNINYRIIYDIGVYEVFKAMRNDKIRGIQHFVADGEPALPPPPLSHYFACDSSVGEMCLRCCFLDMLY